MATLPQKKKTLWTSFSSLLLSLLLMLLIPVFIFFFFCTPLHDNAMHADRQAPAVFLGYPGSQRVVADVRATKCVVCPSISPDVLCQACRWRQRQQQTPSRDSLIREILYDKDVCSAAERQMVFCTREMLFDSFRDVRGTSLITSLSGFGILSWAFFFSQVQR